MEDNLYQENQNQPFNQPNSGQQEEMENGPRRMSFFVLVLKVLSGFAGGTAGSIVLLLIFLLASSILQPVLSPAEATAGEISPLFIVILMAMVFATSVVSSIVAPLLLSYTERERYPRLASSLYQIFIINLVIFIFISPVYLTTSSSRLELTAYAAGLQIVMSAIASSLILEVLNDYKYALLGVYSTILGVLIATAINLFIFQFLNSPTILMFVALPIIWGAIGFFQSAFAMFYYWYYTTWGIDFLATANQIGQDYGIEEEQEEVLPEDRSGGDFLRG